MRLKEFTNANWKTIAARNNLANPDLIMPGQVLDVGDGLVLPKGTTYIVKSGDTLSGIAQKIRRGWLPGTASTTAEPDMPVASSTQANTADTSKPNVTSPVLKPPVINLPRVDSPEFKGGGRGTMPADRNQTPPVADKAKPTRPDYHDPVYDAPPDTKSAPAVRTGPLATAQDLEAAKQDLKKYQAALKDLESAQKKDDEIAKQLEKQDRKRQKLPTFLPPMPNKTAKPSKASKTPTDTGSYDGEFKKIRDIESGNRDYDEFNRPVVSPKGARFAAQVIPTTSTDPGFGVKPAANASAEEFNRVGRDYFAAMKNKYGNSELAAAAYNAGPGRVDKILQKAKQTGRDWKTMLPRETQKYLDKFKGK